MSTADPDPQKHPLYRAEDAAFPNEKVELALSELEWLAEEIAGAGWFGQRYGVREFIVTDGRGHCVARAGKGKKIHLPHGTRLKCILVHEIAHKVDLTGTEDHGAVFAAIYLFLVGRIYSPNAKRRLAYHFRQESVTWDHKIARTGKP